MDELFELLSDGVRRDILVALATGADSLTVPDDLVDGHRDAERLAVALAHAHLPKLADAGVIEWNRQRGIVSRGSSFEKFEPLLRSLSTHLESPPTQK